MIVLGLGVVTGFVVAASLESRVAAEIRQLAEGCRRVARHAFLEVSPRDLGELSSCPTVHEKLPFGSKHGP